MTKETRKLDIERTSESEQELWLNYFNRDIKQANELIEESNKEGFNKWASLIDSLIAVSKHYSKYIQNADEDDEQAQIFGYKLTELSEFIIFAEKENFKANCQDNLKDLELYFLMQYHLNQDEPDLAFSLGLLTQQDDYINKKFYLENEEEDYQEDLATIKEEFDEMYEQVADILSSSLQEEIKQDPKAYYLSKIQ